MNFEYFDMERYYTSSEYPGEVRVLSHRICVVYSVFQVFALNALWTYAHILHGASLLFAHISK